MNVANTPEGYYDPRIHGTQYQKHGAPVTESRTTAQASSADAANEYSATESKGPRYDQDYGLYMMNRMQEAAKQNPINANFEEGEGTGTVWLGSASSRAGRKSLLYDENGFSRELEDPLTVAYFDKRRNPQTWSEIRRAELHRKLGGLPSMDKSSIPKENFLDAAVEQYKKEYAAIESKGYETANQEALQKSVLDLDFIDYVQKGFERAGLSKEDASSAADVFSREFRMGMIDRKGFEQSQLNALRKLNEVSPNLIKQIQYSNYSFDFGV